MRKDVKILISKPVEIPAFDISQVNPIVRNPDFTGSLAKWTQGNGWTWSSDEQACYVDDGTHAAMYQTILDMPAERPYKFTIAIDNYVQGAIQAQFGSIVQSFSGNGTHTWNFYADLNAGFSDTLYLQPISGASGYFEGCIDRVALVVDDTYEVPTRTEYQAAGWLDTKEDSPIALNGALHAFQDLRTRNTSYSKRFQVPNSNRNAKLLDHIIEASSEKFSKENGRINVAKKLKADVYVEDTLVFEAWLQAYGSNKYRNDQEGRDSEIELVLHDSTRDFWSLAQNYHISDLPVDHLNHKKKWSNIWTTWGTTDGAYKYILPFVSEEEHVENTDESDLNKYMKVSHFDPAFSYLYMINRGANELGYGITTPQSVLDNLQRYIGKEQVLSKEQARLNSFEGLVRENGLPSLATNNSIQEIGPLGLLSDATYDPSGGWNLNPVPFSWTVPISGEYTFNVDLPLEIITAGGAIGGLPEEQGQTNPWEPSIVKIIIRKNGQDLIQDEQNYSWSTGPSGGTQGFINMKIEDVVETLEVNDYITLHVYHFNRQYFRSGSPGSGVLTTVDLLRQPNSEWSVNKVNDGFGEGSTVEMKEFLPKDTSLADLIEDVCQMFNMIPIIRPKNPKQVILEYNDELFGRNSPFENFRDPAIYTGNTYEELRNSLNKYDEGIDWTHKVDNASDVEEVYMYKVGADQYNFSYPEISTETSNLYKAKRGIPFGSRELKLDVDFIEKTTTIGPKNVGIVPIRENMHGNYVPDIDVAQRPSNDVLLYSKRVNVKTSDIGSTSYSAATNWNNYLINSNHANIFPKRNKMPVRWYDFANEEFKYEQIPFYPWNQHAAAPITHHSYPNLNFNSTTDTFTAEKFGFGFNTGLVNTFHRRQIQSLGNTMLKAKFYLDEKEMEHLKNNMDTKVIFRERTWFINRIIDHVFGDNEKTTTVELIEEKPFGQGLFNNILEEEEGIEPLNIPIDSDGNLRSSGGINKSSVVGGNGSVLQGKKGAVIGSTKDLVVTESGEVFLGDNLKIKDGQIHRTGEWSVGGESENIDSTACEKTGWIIGGNENEVRQWYSGCCDDVRYHWLIGGKGTVYPEEYDT